MHDGDLIRRLGATLVATAGGYLRNPVRREWTTCTVCATPVSGYRMCFACNQARVHSGLADRVAALTYAVEGSQSGYVMRGYKRVPPIEEHRRIVAMLLLLALRGHASCPGVLARASLTHWATVPSLPMKPGEHPFHRIVGGIAPGKEAPLRAQAAVANPRGVNGTHFVVDVPLPVGSHVLLMDDTWVKGGHAQSAVLALRAAGARKVSVLVVARWIKERFAENAAFLKTLPDYDPWLCPWTGAGCPNASPSASVGSARSPFA